MHLAALARLCVTVGRLSQWDTDRGTATGTALLALALIESLAGNDAVDFCEDVLEGKLNVAGIQSRGLNEGEVVVAGKLLGLLGRYSAQVSQIGLVSDQHDDNVTVGMVSQLLEPSGDVLVCLVLADVVDEQGTDGAAVVS